MAKLIDADRFIEKVNKDREHEIYLHSWTADMVLKRLDSWYAPPVEAIPKAEYENRLKADMVAMLEKLKKEIEQLPIIEHLRTHKIYIDADDFKENVLAILDKYKSESETQESEDT